MPGERIGNSNQYLTISGVVSAPAYSWASDNDTGLYRIGANNIGIAANGTKVLDIATTAVTITPATTLSAALTYGGVTLSNAVTGTGNMVLSASPTFTGTVAVAAVTATSLALGGATLGTNALAVTGTTQLNSALNYGGVTLSNSVTGTGSMVLSTSPQFATSVGIGMTPVNVLDITQSQNTTSQISLLNNSAGAAALALLNVTNGLTNVNLGLCGTGYTTNGTLVANRAFMFAAAAAGIAITASGGPVVFGSGSNTEVARFDTSGRLGIGMTPSNVLDVSKTQNGESRISILNNGGGAAAAAVLQATNGTHAGVLYQFGTGYTTSGILRQDGTCLSSGSSAGGLTLATFSSSPIYFGVGLAEVARFDTNGYLGIGTTPNAWGSGYGVLDLKNGASLVGQGISTLYLTQNTYFDGTNWKYIASAEASIYAQASGSHRWYSISTGTAGNTATVSEKMRLDASGNLGIGMTPSFILDVTQSTNAQSAVNIRNTSTGSSASASFQAQNDTGYAAALLMSSSTTSSWIGAHSAVLYSGSAPGGLTLATGAATPIYFKTNLTEVARFDTNGQLGIGMTPSQVLDITKNHNNFSAVQITNSNAGASAYSGYQINNGSITGGIILSGSGNAEANTVVVYANSGGSVSIQPSGGSGITQFKTNGSESARIDASGNLLVGTTSSNGRISLQTPSGTGTSIGALQVGTGEWGIGSTASSNYFWLTNRTGTAALGLASQSIGISSAGAVRMGAYGAGTATFDASGNITSVSDPSQKNFVASYKRGLPEILAIAKDDKFLGLHTWRKESGMETEGVYASFFAHDDFPITDAVHKGANGINSFSDRPVIMALVNAVAELTTRLSALENK